MRSPVRFRPRVVSDPRHPILVDVSVDDGKTWHDVPLLELATREAMDEMPVAKLTVLLDPGEVPDA